MQLHLSIYLSISISAGLQCGMGLASFSASRRSFRVFSVGDPGRMGYLLLDGMYRRKSHSFATLLSCREGCRERSFPRSGPSSNGWGRWSSSSVGRRIPHSSRPAKISGRAGKVGGGGRGCLVRGGFGFFAFPLGLNAVTAAAAVSTACAARCESV